MIQKYIFLLLLIGTLGVKAQEERNETSAGDPISEQKEALKVVLASVQGGPQAIQELQNIQVQFTLVAQELGLTRLFNRLRAVIQEECDFIRSDQSIQSLMRQSSAIGRRIQESMKSPDFQDVQQLQKSLQILMKATNPSVKEKKQRDALQNQIKTRIDQKVGPLIQQAQTITKRISQQLQPYTVQINLLSKRIQDIIKNNDRIAELRKRILDFKNNSSFRQVFTRLQPQLEENLDTLGTLYEKEDAAEQPCVLMSPGTFVPSSNLFDLINQSVIDMLIKS